MSDSKTCYWTRRYKQHHKFACCEVFFSCTTRVEGVHADPIQSSSEAVISPFQSQSVPPLARLPAPPLHRRARSSPYAAASLFLLTAPPRSSKKPASPWWPSFMPSASVSPCRSGCCRSWRRARLSARPLLRSSAQRHRCIGPSCKAAVAAFFRQAGAPRCPSLMASPTLHRIAKRNQDPRLQRHQLGSWKKRNSIEGKEKAVSNSNGTKTPARI